MPERGQTDEEALQAYLQETKGIKIDAYAAARLHNKVYVDQDGQLAFPSRAQAQLNFKVLLNFSYRVYPGSGWPVSQRSGPVSDF